MQEALGRIGNEQVAAVAPPSPAVRAARRLPVQTDWPLWAILLVQVAILLGVLALWEAAASKGWIDAFFWSQPSAIFHTMVIFFTAGDAWTDIGFTFRSTVLGFLIGTVAGSLFGLSFWWPQRDRSFRPDGPTNRDRPHRGRSQHH